jgi:hypothetical protein
VRELVEVVGRQRAADPDRLGGLVPSDGPSLGDHVVVKPAPALVLEGGEGGDVAERICGCAAHSLRLASLDNRPSRDV